MKNNAMPASEDAILACIDRHFDNTPPRFLLGRGDDCAVLKNARNNICVSADMFLEDIHFRRSYFSPYEIGHKALAVNISDLAGFGAKPLAFTLCLGIPKDLDMDWLNSFFEGMAALSNKYRVPLAGGDLSRADKLHVSISIMGENQDNCGFLGRAGSLPGDILFVVGNIGLARIGLKSLEEEGRSAMEKFPTACLAHLIPKPQIEAGLMLARAGYNSRPPALMDLSDGLVIDLPRLLGWNKAKGDEKKLGAKLFLSRHMLHPEIIDYSFKKGLDPLEEAILGGEDYALLGSCAPDLFAPLRTAIPELWKIGEVDNSGLLTCPEIDIAGLIGFDHFAGN